MHALIIEDEALGYLSVRDLLADLGFVTFDAATTEAHAISYAERKAPDLIIADYRLATGTGVDAVTAICARKPTPVLFVTATPDLVTQRIEGAIVLSKPYEENAFLKACTQVMAGAKFAPVAKPDAETVTP